TRPKLHSTPSLRTHRGENQTVTYDPTPSCSSSTLWDCQSADETMSGKRIANPLSTPDKRLSLSRRPAVRGIGLVTLNKNACHHYRPFNLARLFFFFSPCIGLPFAASYFGWFGVVGTVEC